MTPKMTVAKQHISSASLTGPYWNDINFSPMLAVPDVSFAGVVCRSGFTDAMPPGDTPLLQPSAPLSVQH